MPKIIDIDTLKSKMASSGMPTTSLVKRSGLSRAQIHRILSSTDQVKVRDETLNRLAQALGLQPVDLAADGRLSEFRKWMTEQHAFVDFRGMGMPLNQRQKIDAVYVEPYVVPVKGISDEKCLDTKNPSFHTSLRMSLPLPATKAIQTHDRLVLLGDPGSGKTMVLKKMAHSNASTESGQTALPIHVHLPEFSRALEIDERTDIVNYLAGTAVKRCPEIETSLREELTDDKRQCLILLDGLDEVGTEREKEQLVTAIRQFVERYPRNRFVITSRAVGFDSEPWVAVGFSVFRMKGYDTKQQNEFAEKWAKIFADTSDRSADEILNPIKSAIFSNARVRALSSNPLILTILVLLNESRGGALPRRRVDLYAKIVEVLLETWERSKSATDAFDETSNIDLDEREFRWLLSDLALAMQKNDRTLAPRWWIADRMTDYLQQKMGFAYEQAKDACDRMIRYLTERTGLIEERGLELFGFSHRTLQEYFASLGIIDEADASNARDVTDCLRGYHFHPQWSEVVRLVAAQLTPSVAESVIASILDDPDPVGRFLRRGPLLALRCLSDGTTIPNRNLVTNTFNSLTDLGRSKWLGVTIQAFDVLENFDGTRFEQAAKNTMESILHTAMENLSSDDYKMLNEYRLLSTITDSQELNFVPELQSEVAKEVEIVREGKAFKIVILNTALRLENPAIWYQSLCTLLKNQQQDDDLKELLIREIGQEVATGWRARRALRKILQSEASATLRAAAAAALGLEIRQSDLKLLVRCLEQDSDDQVRAACAAALKQAATDDVSVRDKLLRILDSKDSEVLRAGAAIGLSSAACKDSSLTDRLLRYASKPDLEFEFRAACAWALESQIGHNATVTEAFESWLEQRQPEKIQRIAAQALATSMADEAILWDYHLVEKVEGILMSLENPCPHALESLKALARTRAVRRGLRLENVIRDSLSSFIGKLEQAFVFGSTARKRQAVESDIDLMLIGEITLKDLSTPLRIAEKTLGRRISPVIYTSEIFRKKFHSGDPFLLDVYRREKIPILQHGLNTSQRDLDNELRAMVSERLA